MSIYEDQLKRGWPLFPVLPDKRPAVKGWEKAATCDPGIVSGWLAEDMSGTRPMGVALGRAGLLVIDVDSPAHAAKGGPDGAKSLEAFVRDNGRSWQQTYTVKTPTGGTHYYFRAPGLRGQNAWLPGVDVKASGGYVLAAGSVTGAGKYEVIDGHDPIDLPKWLADGYAESHAVVERQESPINVHVTPDSPVNVHAAIDMLQGMETVPEGQRNMRLYQAARDMCRLGISWKTAQELYDEYGLAIGLEPSSQEVQATISSAYSDMSDFGAESSEARAEASRLAFLREPSNLPEGLADEFTDAGYQDWVELEHMDVPPRRWFIEGWLSADKGYTVLFTGKGGTGKSMLMLQLMRSLATGEDFLGKPVLRRGKTLFVSCEDSDEDIARRVIMQSAGKSPMPQGLAMIWPRWGKDSLIAMPSKSGRVIECAFLAELEKRAADFFQGDGGVLILDTVSDIFGGEENSRAQVSQFVKRIIGGLAIRLGVTVVVLGHPSKSAEEGAAYSGSTAWEGAFRCRWELTKESADKGAIVLNLSLAKSNSVNAGEKIKILNKDGILVKIEASEYEDKLKRLIVEEIARAEEAGNPYGLTNRASRPVCRMAIKDPLTDAQVPERSISEMIEALISSGEVVKSTKGGRGVLTVPGGDSQWI